jgi:transposase
MNKSSFSGFLGVDISKDKFDAYCVDMNGEKHFYLSCSMDRAGFEKLVSRLESLSTIMHYRLNIYNWEEL